ncbi:MAG: N-acetylneuraminate synthase family protein [Leptospirales bacterium]
MFDSGEIRTLFKEKHKYKKTYIIAEVGINHNGDLNKALNLIKAAKESGVNAVKFQKRDLKSIYSENVLNDANASEWTFEYLIPLLKEFELSEDDYLKIRNYCDTLKIDLIITPFDEKSAEFVANLGISAFKIASADMTNIPLVKKCAGYNIPLLISTGMWNDEDIEKCANIYKTERIDFAFLLAQSTYPAPFESLKLDYINRLKEFSDVVGYSGHERGTFIPVAATAMGCQIIEKHITFDKNEKGPDHKASMLPAEWNEMVYQLRTLEKARGSQKRVNQAEIQNKEAFAKSAVPIRDLPEGHVLIKSDIIFKAPGKGIFPHDIANYFGKVLKKTVKKEHYINTTDFEDTIEISQWESFQFSKQWGIKCRFHDFEEYNILNSPCVEFHCSQTDLDIDFKPGEVSKSELIVHAPEIYDRKLVDICVEDETSVKQSLDILQRSIDKTLSLSKYFSKEKKPKLVIHAGGMFLNTANLVDTEELTNRAIENFKLLKFNSDDIDILPENLPPRPWYLGGEWFQHGFMLAKDMIHFCDSLGLGMTYDICHASLYCNEYDIDLASYTKEVMPFTKHIHISDAYGINGEGVQIGEGHIDFEKVLKEVEPYQFTWVPEIWSGHLHYGAGTYKCMQILNSKFFKAL